MFIYLGEVHENAPDEDEESKIETPVNGPVTIAKDGTKWAEIPTSERQVANHNIVRQKCGPNRNTNTFKIFFTPEMIIIRHRNKKAQHCNIK